MSDHRERATEKLPPEVEQAVLRYAYACCGSPSALKEWDEVIAAILAALREAREGAIREAAQAVTSSGSCYKHTLERAADRVLALAPAPSTTRAPGGGPQTKYLGSGVCTHEAVTWDAQKGTLCLACGARWTTRGEPVLPEERGTAGDDTKPGRWETAFRELAKQAATKCAAAPETPATGPCDECGGPFYEGRRGWPVHQVGAGWSRKVHERCSSALSPGATRGDGRTP